MEGNSCEKAAAAVNTLDKFADTEDGKFGEYILSTDGSITSAGTAVSIKPINSTTALTNLDAKIYLPQCNGAIADNGMGGNNSYFNLQPALLAVLKSINNFNLLGNSVDSTATAGNDKFLQQVEALFKENGIDPALSNIQSWGYSKKGLMMWSATDISTVKSGSSVLAMRYNSNTGTYTVGYATVQTKGTGSSAYNTFFDDGGGEKWKEATDAGKQNNKTSFDAAMAYYNQLTSQQ